MVTVAHIVEKIVEERPFIQEALARGIINHAALAEEMTPEIEHELKKKVKFSAVNMAIRRLSEKLGETFVVKAKFDKHASITIKSDLICMTVYKVPEIEEKYILKIYGIIDFKNGDFLTITHGLNEVMIITNNKYKKNIEHIFPEKIIKNTIRDLSSITIKIPPESVETAGLFYIVTRALSWENITIVDIVSTLTEMTVIIKEDDTARAFDCFKKLIKSNS